MKFLLIAVLAVLFTIVFANADAKREISSCMKSCWKNKGSYKECAVTCNAIRRGRRAMETSTLSDSENTVKCVSTDSLNVRSGPGTNYSTRRSIRRNERVTIYQTSGTWVRIAASEWVHSGYLSNCASTPSTPTTPSTGSSGLTIEKLREIMPRLSSSKAQEYLPYLNSAMASGSINNCQRISAFLAQLAHESGQLQWWEEFASGAAYEGRRDLGNTQPGDGRRFKGRGPIQLTGRANYRSAGSALGLPLESNPEMAKNTDVGFRTAVWFWSTRSLNNYADGSQSGFDQITRRINGGYNGKADRDQYFRKAKSLLGC